MLERYAAGCRIERYDYASTLVTHSSRRRCRRGRCGRRSCRRAARRGLAAWRCRPVCAMTKSTDRCLQIAFCIDQKVGCDHDVFILLHATENLHVLCATRAKLDLARLKAAGARPWGTCSRFGTPDRMVSRTPLVATERAYRIEGRRCRSANFDMPTARTACSRNARTLTALAMQGLPSYLPSMLAMEPGDASAARLFHLVLARFGRN